MHVWLDGVLFSMLGDGYTLTRTVMPHGSVDYVMTLPSPFVCMDATATHLIIGTAVELLVLQPCGRVVATVPHDLAIGCNIFTNKTQVVATDHREVRLYKDISGSGTHDYVGLPYGWFVRLLGDDGLLVVCDNDDDHWARFPDIGENVRPIGMHDMALRDGTCIPVDGHHYDVIAGKLVKYVRPGEFIGWRGGALHTIGPVSQDLKYQVFDWTVHGARPDRLQRVFRLLDS